MAGPSSNYTIGGNDDNPVSNSNTTTPTYVPDTMDVTDHPAYNKPNATEHYDGMVHGNLDGNAMIETKAKALAWKRMRQENN